MAYDMPNTAGGIGVDPATHSNFEKSQAAVEHQLASGLPAAKLVLGIPAYGRLLVRDSRAFFSVICGVKLSALVFFSSVQRNPGVVQTYAEAVDSPHYGGSPLRRGGDFTGDGFGLDGPATVRRKVAWAASKGLAGVMIWELGQDKLGHAESLLAAAANASSFVSSIEARSGEHSEL
jgi:GH18 family chitinase